MYDFETWRMTVALEREQGARRLDQVRELERVRPPQRHLVARVWSRRGAAEGVALRIRPMRQRRPSPGSMSPTCRDS